MSIQIEVRNKRATNLTPDEVIVCGNKKYVVEFTFDAEWESEPAKTARFVYRKDGKNRYIDVPFVGTTVNVPMLSNIYYVLVGVYAGDLTTTTPALVNCDKSILCGVDAREEPTPDVYSQLMELINTKMVQADWAENDREANSYVKNRTHFTYPVRDTVSREFAVSGDEFAMITDEEFAALLLENYATAKYYDANGECVYIENSFATVGNQKSWKVYRGGSTSTSLLPSNTWTINISGGVITFGLGEADEFTTGSIEIEAVTEHVKKLDDKYIPDTIARISDVEELLGVIENGYY